MDGYGVVLALHITSVVAAFFLAGALHASEYLMKGATSVAEVRRLTRTVRFAPLFAPIVIAIFAFGSVLLHLDEGSAYDMGDAWIWTAMLVLLVLILDGPLVLARYAKRLDALVAETPDGPVPEAVRAQVTATVPWVVSHANSFLALSVILNMATKPGTGAAVATVVIGAALGASIGYALSRR